MMLDKKQIQAIFLFEFKMGLKATETTQNINNARPQLFLYQPKYFMKRILGYLFWPQRTVKKITEPLRALSTEKVVDS